MSFYFPRSHYKYIKMLYTCQLFFNYFYIIFYNTLLLLLLDVLLANIISHILSLYIDSKNIFFRTTKNPLLERAIKRELWSLGKVSLTMATYNIAVDKPQCAITQWARLA